MKKKLFLTLVSALMVLAMLPSAAFAGADTQTGEVGQSSLSGKTIDAVAEQFQDPNNDPFRYTSSELSAAAAAKEYPSSLDLREKGYVTPVKFQNPFGTCWGFAAVAASETSLLGSGLAAKDGYDADTLNLSEKHLTYFVNQSINDTTNPQYGEGTHSKEGLSQADLFNTGGVPFYATSLFASGIGPNLEDRDSVLKYMGKNGWTMKRSVNGKVIDYCYDDEDDWSISDEWKFKQSYVLKESYLLPSPAVVDRQTKAYTYDPAGTAAIKDMLMENRAVVIGFRADSSTPTQEVRDGAYISVNWAHYTYEPKSANHGVTIVGWDDNYSKENFIEGHQPPEDGAWLVKNSWGSEEEEFPNKGPGWGLENEKGEHTGYFWLSYYDQTICLLEAYSFDKSNVGSSYNLDEHDFMPVSDVEAAAYEDEMKMANVFKADECEVLEQVSCETTYPGTTVRSDVYLLSDDFDDPTDGVLMSSISETYEYGGFHKMDLTDSVIIQKGQYYSIVQTQTTTENKYSINTPLGLSKKFMEEYYDGETWQVGVINERESYLLMDGKWYDYSRTDIKKKFFADEYDYYAYDNFPIKGYCVPKSNVNMKLNGTRKLSLADGKNTSELTLYYKGDSGDEFATPSITWELAEGGSEYFTLTQDASNPSWATLKAKAIGETQLYVTAEGIGTMVAPISVKKLTINDISVNNSSIEYDGKAHKPKVKVSDELGDLISSSHYTVKYKNNKKCGVAEAVVTIKSGDAKYEGSESVNFTIYPKRAAITGLSTGTGRLTVSVKNQKASGVSKYCVKYRVKGSSTWSTKTFKAKSGTKLTIKGLKKGKRYEVKVCAIQGTDNAGKYSKLRTSGKIS